MTVASLLIDEDVWAHIRCFSQPVLPALFWLLKVLQK